MDDSNDQPTPKGRNAGACPPLIGGDGDDVGPTPPPGAARRASSLLPSEEETLRGAIDDLARSGRHAVLIGADGRLKPETMTTVAKHIRSGRQGDFFRPAETVGQLLARLAEAAERKRARA